MRNSLQDQLLKAGLADEKKAKAVNREKAQARKQGQSDDSAARDAAAALAEKAARDRLLAEQQKAEARERERKAQVRQIIEHYKQKRGGDVAYNFSAGGKVKTIYVSEKLRTQIVKGQLIIVSLGDSYELVPRVAAEKIRERDAAAIVLDNAGTAGAATVDEDDPYKDFPVPDDLMW